MPVPPTYPGVYVEEIPSGVRTIAGVPTSVTAFIGRAPRGTENKAVTVRGFGDYTRDFGGLAADSTMSYAVRDFFNNGGGEALIVRVTPSDAAYARILLPADGGSTFTLIAASKGKWGNNLHAAVDYNTFPKNDDTFNLIVQESVEEEGETHILSTETFLNVSIDPDSARYVVRVLKNGSNLVRVEEPLPDPFDRPDPTIEFDSIPDTSIPQEKIVFVPSDGNGSDGGDLAEADYVSPQHEQNKTGLYAFVDADIFNLLCIPPPVYGGDTPPTLFTAGVKLCRKERAMLLVDPPAEWGDNPNTAVAKAATGRDSLGIDGLDQRNAALYFPRIYVRDPLRDNQPMRVVPSGAVAGAIAATDARRGVWKAPAGTEAGLSVDRIELNLTDGENGTLNPLGINCLRRFPVIGNVVWGARTMRGANVLGDEWKYVPVRRLALYLEESLYRSLHWVVFEPNDEPLWSQIRLNVGSFMHDLFRQGAFQGKTPRDAYLVKCDRETTTQSDINAGVVNVLVGFAPLKPAEFVYIRIQQLAGQIQT